MREQHSTSLVTGLCPRDEFCEAEGTAAGTATGWSWTAPVAQVFSCCFLLFYVFVSHKPLGRKINWNCVRVNMSPTEFNYSGSETVTIERGSLWAREYSLSKFIKAVACLVLSTVPLTHVIPTLRLPGLPGHHGSSMPPYCFQEALSNSYPSTRDY